MSDVLLVLVHAVTVAVASIRWLRVGQREHYEPGRVTRFAARWWSVTPANLALGVLAVAAALVTLALSGLARLVPAAVVLAVLAVAPLRLGLRGRTAPLKWTRRLSVVAGLTALVAAVLALLAGLVTVSLLPLLAVLQPLVVDAAMAIDRPIERLLSQRFVRDAQQRLQRVDPQVIAITGSYGKTSVKNYTAHLLSQSRTTIASRKSFNNRLGLAMSVNQDLQPGTDCFIAEMGTYGVGEIAELCSWLPPSISAITAIGPVHLERMGTLDTIARAKSEILDPADTVVLNVDDERLAPLADRSASQGKRVVRCSTRDEDADVLVREVDGGLHVAIGEDSWDVPAPAVTLVPINLAIAIGLCIAADAVPVRMEDGIASLPAVENRLTVTTMETGPSLIDDTYNSNPAGAHVALERLATTVADAGGRGIVVSPGMVELGPRQTEENRRFARSVAEQGADLIVVGRTNHDAMAAGYREAAGSAPISVDHREAAVAWIREHAGTGDVVLFENDLPDHFP